jgi:HK97 family phage major capsid protein
MGTATITRDAAERPFESFGEQLKAIWRAADSSGASIDKRLLALNAKSISGGSTTIGSDGGFAVQEDFAEAVIERASQESVLFERADRTFHIADDADKLNVPYIDETSRATGSRWGGVRVYRAGEADDVTASRPKMGNMELTAYDLRGLAYMTDRLKRDAPALSGLYVRAFGKELGWVLSNEILRGTGVGECLGILKSPALITVTKESGQTAATVLLQNVVNMKSRLHAAGRRTSAWFVHQEVEKQLPFMKVGAEAPQAYVYATGSDPFDRLLGIPVIPIEQTSALGTLGDIVLADQQEYAIVQKGGPEHQFSMHVRFVNHENVFRIQWRVNGQPKWKSALTPANGTDTVSPFVALATRA